MHIFMAQNSVRVGERHLDKLEELDLIVIPFGKPVDMVMKSETRCNISTHGVLRVARIIGVSWLRKQQKIRNS